MTLPHLPSLRLEGLHVFIADGDTPVGGRAVEEFLSQGCKVTAHFSYPRQLGNRYETSAPIYAISGDISDEKSMRACFGRAVQKFGPINILAVDTGFSNESRQYSILDIPVGVWETTCQPNARCTFIIIQQFLRVARETGLDKGSETLAIVAMGDRFGLREGLIREMNYEIDRLGIKARINAVAPWIYSHLGVDGYDPEQLWRVPTAIIPWSKFSGIQGAARAMVILASDSTAGSVSGQYVSINIMNGDFILHGRENAVMHTPDPFRSPFLHEGDAQFAPDRIVIPKRKKIRIAVSVDLDAVSGWLGTGQHPDNMLADYSSGFFAAKVGVPRLLRMLKKLGLANSCTWFIPGHSAESFPEEVRQVVEAGCEIGLHGYAHEGAYQLTPEQERDVLKKCIDVATKLTGERPVGYRAPLYQLRESTLDLLEEFGFEYDASLTDHDCHPFFAPRRPPIKPIDFSKPASTWMHPTPQPPTDRRPLVCIPCNWYMEDMTPMQYLPHVHNSHGYVDVRVVENLWRDRFLWIRENEEEPVFPVLMHPDTSGMAHVIGMLERMLTWLKGWGDEVEFCQSGEIARWWREKEMGK